MSRVVRAVSLFGSIALLSVAGCATPGAGGNWTCSASGLASAKYDGSGSAYVHLSGFQTGDSYPVKLNDAKTEAAGTTANGTPFTCKKAA